jgi:hypothetical protein
VDAEWKEMIRGQFGAAIDMLENAIRNCPEKIWADRNQKPEFWYLAFHTLFWLDLYLSDSGKKFIPPAPFTLTELDPAGLLPERVYSKKELLTYLDYGLRKCRRVINELSEEKAAQRFQFGSIDLQYGELILYNMRHVQHHAAQLNLILRQKTDSAPSWVKKRFESL